MRLNIIIIFTLLSSSSWALPKKIEFLFLSEAQITSLLERVNKPALEFLKTAENIDNYECQPVDGGCFHPQLGFIDKVSKPVKDIKNNNLKTLQKVQPSKAFNSLDSNMVECKKGNYFDIFCGKAEKVNQKQGNGIEIWMDVSSSMRKMDYSTDINHCARRSFAQKIDKGCGPGKVSFSVFNTSKKEIGEFSTLCINHGLNDQDRLIKWIKSSTAKYLLVITDIDELSVKMRDFLDSESAEFHGSGIKDFTSKNLDNFTKNVIKTCKKI